MTIMDSEALRNIAVVGAAGVGKTSLCEMLLHAGAAIVSPGSVERGTTISSSDPMEKEMGHTLEPWLCHLEFGGLRLHLLDTPGYVDLLGRTLSVLPAVDAILLVISAASGPDTVADRLMETARERGLDCFIVIHKMDTELAGAQSCLQEIQTRWGKHCLPLNLPKAQGSAVADCYFSPGSTDTDFGQVDAAHEALIDQIVEVDEDLMARYLEQGEALTPEQLHGPFERALRENHIVPVCFCASKTGAGVADLLKVLMHLAPNPFEGNPPAFLKGEGNAARPVKLDMRTEAHALAHVFHITVDPFVGRIAWLRVHQGQLRVSDSLFIGDARKSFKLNHLLRLQGKQTREINSAMVGDIVAIAKVDDLFYDAVIHADHDEDHHHLLPRNMPAPVFELALRPVRHGDEQKLSDVLHKLTAEDPSLSVQFRADVNETVLSGLGELHLKVALAKMQTLAQLELTTHAPSVPYRETITRPAEGHCRHKKQSGGAGQFAEVSLRIAPLARGAGFEFVDEVVGGAIPGQFIPAIEKGVREVLQTGAVAGFSVVDVRVTVVDGKHHTVDSKDIAFVTAGRKAFLEAIDKAGPSILEPVFDLQIHCDAHHVGDIGSELTTRRGVIMATDMNAAQQAVIQAQLPLAEIGAFQTRLKALSGGSAHYRREFKHYDVAPVATQQQLQGKYKRKEEE